MSFTLGQHLRRAQSKAENLRLFAVDPCYFLSAVWLPHDQFLAVIKETV